MPRVARCHPVKMAAAKREECPPKRAGMRGQTKAAVRVLNTKAFGCADNPQSVPTPWVEPPGQDSFLWRDQSKFYGLSPHAQQVR